MRLWVNLKDSALKKHTGGYYCDTYKCFKKAEKVLELYAVEMGRFIKEGGKWSKIKTPHFLCNQCYKEGKTDADT